MAALMVNRAMPAFLLVLLFIVPVSAVFAFMLQDAFSPVGWLLLGQHPQLWSALRLSLFTGVASTVIALFLSLLIGIGFFQSGSMQKLPKPLGAMLALPHLAFAIGLSFLAMPSGLIARIAAAMLGWSTPPDAATIHDPYGLALSFALACKETCFLLFAVLQMLNKPDKAASLHAQSAAAQSLGHGGLSTATRVVLPQLWSELTWPLVIAFVYATSVVDMALVLGPTQPPTLAQLAWMDINAADMQQNARGGAAAVLLALASAAVVAGGWVTLRRVAPMLRNAAAAGPNQRAFPNWLARAKWGGLFVIFAASALMLVLLSVAQMWTFPSLVPQTSSTASWVQVVTHPAAVLTSLSLGLSCAVAGLALAVAWFESAPQRWDNPLLAIALLFLGLPALLTGLGEYRLLLRFGLIATAPGLFIAHLLPALAYMFILLAGPYRRFDPHWRMSAQGLLVTPSQFLTRVKWPMLKAPLAAAAALGFAVAIAQYVPAQLVSAGRFDTLTLEAVTLSSGSNRSLTATFALALALLPLLAFLAASWLGRARRFSP